MFLDLFSNDTKLKSYKVDGFSNKLNFNNVAGFIQERFDEFVKILPIDLQEDFKKEGFVAGGSIWTYVNRDFFKDIDLFVETEEMRNRLVAFAESVVSEHEYMTTSGKLRRGKYNGFEVVLTDNAITVDKIFQVVIKDWGTPEDVVGSFDFLHSMNYVKNGTLYTVGGLCYIKSDTLKFNEGRARNMCGVISRIPKFIDRGMTISQQEMSKVLLRLRDTGFEDSDIDVMEFSANYGAGGFGSGGEE